MSCLSCMLVVGSCAVIGYSPSCREGLRVFWPGGGGESAEVCLSVVICNQV